MGIDVMNNIENRFCSTCKYFYNSEDMWEEDHVCVNDQSDNLADYVSEDDSCAQWTSNDSLLD